MRESDQEDGGSRAHGAEAGVGMTATRDFMAALIAVAWVSGTATLARISA